MHWRLILSHPFVARVQLPTYVASKPTLMAEFTAWQDKKEHLQRSNKRQDKKVDRTKEPSMPKVLTTFYPRTIYSGVTCSSINSVVRGIASARMVQAGSYALISARESLLHWLVCRRRRLRALSFVRFIGRCSFPCVGIAHVGPV